VTEKQAHQKRKYNKYNLKAVGEIGHLVLSKDRAHLENALRFFSALAAPAKLRAFSAAKYGISD